MDIERLSVVMWGVIHPFGALVNPNVRRNLWMSSVAPGTHRVSINRRGRSFKREDSEAAAFEGLPMFLS